MGATKGGGQGVAGRGGTGGGEFGCSQPEGIAIGSYRWPRGYFACLDFLT